jgi:methyltransferase-like protein
MKFLLDNCAPNSAYGTVLERGMSEIKNLVDEQLFHEYLEPNNDPVYFHEFAARSQAAGLQYLGDVEFSRMLTEFLPKNARDSLTGLSMMQQEQYMDFLRNRTFRRTLLCHDDVALNRNLSTDNMRKFHFGLVASVREDQIDLASTDPVNIVLGEHKISSAEPIVKAAIKQLARQWPGTMSFDDLHAASLKLLPAGKRARRSGNGKGAASTSEAKLASSLMTYLGGGLVHAWVHPPKPLSPVGEKPLASSLARAQARLGNTVSNFRHQQIMLNDTERHLIGLLDGKHDRETLIDSLRSAFSVAAMMIKSKGEALKDVSGEHLTVILDKTLSRLHSAALIEG